MSVEMEPDEVRAFLEEAHTAVLTTLRSDGRPVSLPVWFLVDGDAVLVAGLASGAKFSRVRRDPRVSVLVEDGERWAELRAVHLEGTAELVEDPDWEAVDARFDAKYAGARTPRDEMPESARRHYDAARALLRIVPEGRPISWDNRKLGGS